MHSLNLVTFTLPHKEEEIEKNMSLGDISEKAVQEKRICLGVLNILERYYKATDNLDYLKFCDITEELKKKYNGTTECLKLPQGTIVSLEEPKYYYRYVIHDEKVYEKYSGPARQDRRTKCAKRIKALIKYPWKKLYPNFQGFAEDWSGCRFYEEQDAFGYYYNPEGYWDWYSIGGRWVFLLLVKISCKEYCVGKKSCLYEGNIPDAPKGYIWVSGARKKDIEWDTMRKWGTQKLTEMFGKLEHFFLSGVRPDGVDGVLVEDGIVHCGKYVYRKGETLEGYLEKFDFKKDCRYPIAACSFINNAGWYSRWNRTGIADENILTEDEWDIRLGNLLDSIPEDDVLVVVDCHS